MTAAAAPERTRARPAAGSFARDLVRVLGWQLWIAVALAVLLAIFEGAILFLLVPLLQTVGLAINAGPAGRMVEWIIRAFAALGLRATLESVLGVFVVLSLIRVALLRVNYLIGPRLEQQYVLHLEARLYSAIVSARWSYLVRRRSSDLVHAASADINRVTHSAHQVFSVITNLAVSAIYVAFAAQLSLWMTAVVAVVAGAMLWLQRGHNVRAAMLGERHNSAGRRLFGMLSQSLQGLKVAKSFGAEQRDIAIFERLSRAASQAYLEMMRALADSMARRELVGGLVMAGLLFIAVRAFHLGGGELVMLLFVFGRVMPRTLVLQEATQEIAAGLPSYQTIESIIEECSRDAEPSEADGDSRLTLGRELRLDAVTYRYSGADVDAIVDVTIAVPAGTTVAIVGSSGAGKSTIADVLMGLVPPTTGGVALDGRTLDDAALRRWRHSVGYVPQDGFLLNDTVRNNMLWAAPGRSDEEILGALDRAAARSFVDARGGLDTTVGDRGVQFSGGERQRLALARALLTRPDLLLLDEATNALDTVNEQQILESLERLHGRLTIVLITHRLSTVRNADMIFVVEDGRVVEAGAWADLEHHGGAFRRLLDAQGSASSLVGR